MAETNFTLENYLQTKPAPRFSPVANYFAEGDFVAYHFRDERAYEKRLDDLVTIYLSMETDELVGLKVKGIKRILQQMGGANFVVTVTKKPITVSMLLLGAVALEPHSKQLYLDLANRGDLTAEVRNMELFAAA